MNQMQLQTVWISVVGAGIVVAYALLAAVQILVLNPLAATPGLTLGQIRSQMSSAQESLHPTFVLSFLGVGVVLATGIALLSIVRRAHPVVPAGAFLYLLMFGAPGYFVASFGAGMALADTFGISGGDYSPWARPLYAVSALAGLVLIIGVVVGAIRRRPTAATR